MNPEMVTYVGVSQHQRCQHHLSPSQPDDERAGVVLVPVHNSRPEVQPCPDVFHTNSGKTLQLCSNHSEPFTVHHSLDGRLVQYLRTEETQ